MDRDRFLSFVKYSSNDDLASLQLDLRPGRLIDVSVLVEIDLIVSRSAITRRDIPLLIA